jgi:hypothetical protein
LVLLLLILSLKVVQPMAAAAAAVVTIQQLKSVSPIVGRHQRRARAESD